MPSKVAGANPNRLAGHTDPAVGRGQRGLDQDAVRGEAAVTLGVGAEQGVERIPERLRRFL